MPPDDCCFSPHGRMANRSASCSARRRTTTTAPGTCESSSSLARTRAAVSDALLPIRPYALIAQRAGTGVAWVAPVEGRANAK